ncbi:phosphotriesterase [Ohtaekwangia kribbensis]|uniref:Phosphotriesterase n=1 Tax=Ohtaekwangia kribbensis TaxID=688913 RepID=A0ABW3K0B9_9BACT
MDRGSFIQHSVMLMGSLVFTRGPAQSHNTIPGVLGPVSLSSLGVTLIHEHTMVDFIGASETGVHRYHADAVVETVLPYLIALKKAGCATFVDCTPAYIGRDVTILKRLAQASGLNIITNTGYYGAAKEKYLPAHAYTETAEQLATRWVGEFRKGIDGTGIYPGFIKTGVDAGPLTPVCEKLLEAAALAHLQTGLTISAHTGNGEAALQELTILQKAGVSPDAFRWVHAQNEKDKQLHLQAARMGAWIEFDGINGSDPTGLQQHVDFVVSMKEHNLLNKVLISHDAGWYHVGEPDGGTFRSYTALFETFIPALKREGFTDRDIRQLLVDNPRKSLIIRVREL